ncbi:MAG: EVE domain-containing protein, partial [Pirellulales bacterium]|nr:EVE domain-containing protein [Pirellulales bacterium]
AAVGIVEVVKESYPDHFAWKEGHKYQDIKASPEKPIWAMVDVKLVQIFPKEISLEQLRGVKALEGLELLRRGSRLSVHPVSAAHFKVFERLAKQK